MKIFGYSFGKDKTTLAETTPAKGTNSNFAFSTPLAKVGPANLSLPFVSNFYTTNGIVMFGQENLYPQLLNQMTLTSPMLGQCVNFITNAVIGEGYTWANETATASEKVDLLTFERLNKFQKLSRLLTRDYVIHNRVCVEVTRVATKITKLRRLDPSTIRSTADVQAFRYSNDWSRGFFHMRDYVRYSPSAEETTTLYYYQDESPGQSIYAIPSYNSCLNYAALDGEMSFFHKNNLQNSVFPSIVIRRPKDFSSVEEIDQFKREISSKTGAGNAGSVLVLTGNGKDDMPEFQSVAANSNDAAFVESARQCNESIAMAFGINSSLLGVKVAGQLGNTEEIKTSYQIAEKNVIRPTRVIMEEILNDLVDICGVANTVVINDFQLLDGEIVDVTADKLNKLAK